MIHGNYAQCQEQIDNLNGLIDGCHDDELGERLTPARDFLAGLLNAALKDGFLEWSGGTSPESGYQINVYIQNALPVGISQNYAADVLKTWMNDVI